MSGYDNRTAWRLRLMGAALACPIFWFTITAVGFLDGAKIGLLPFFLLASLKGFRDKASKQAFELAQINPRELPLGEDRRRLVGEALTRDGHRRELRKYVVYSGLWDVLEGYALGLAATALVMYIARQP